MINLKNRSSTGCQYCRKAIPYDKYYGTSHRVYIIFHNELYIKIDNLPYYKFSIQYCPFCGRKMYHEVIDNNEIKRYYL